MGRYIINGKNKLEGVIKINGSKNAVLPILAATVIAEGENVIKNCPIISDVVCMTEILRDLGCKVEIRGNDIIVNSKDMNYTVLEDKKASKMRSSVILLGALLSRFKEAEIDYPGGCVIGSRPINYHIQAFKKMGVNFLSETEKIKGTAEAVIGANINLEYPSVGATENIMLLAVKANGMTVIENAAKEPEIIDLQNFLNKCGAKISGAGTDKITILGVGDISAAEYEVMPDRIETGTFLTALMMTKGDLILKNTDVSAIKTVLDKIIYAGGEVCYSDKYLRIRFKGILKAIPITITAPYPNFPTDMQPLIMSMLTISDGTSIIIETVFESRYKHIEEFKKMGARVASSGKIAVIEGVKTLYGAEVYAGDLRGGAALILCGLSAEGQTIVQNSHFVERGYENIEKRLRSLGADISLKD